MNIKIWACFNKGKKCIEPGAKPHFQNTYVSCRVFISKEMQSIIDKHVFGFLYRSMK